MLRLPMLLVLLSALPLFAQAKLEPTKDSLETVLKKVTEKQALLLDVREAEEWKAGHLKDATLVPLSSLRDEAALKTILKDLKKDKPVYLHCGAGRRALQAGEILKKEGYDVQPLKDGYETLLKSGFEGAKK